MQAIFLTKVALLFLNTLHSLLDDRSSTLVSYEGSFSVHKLCHIQAALALVPMIDIGI